MPKPRIRLRDGSLEIKRISQTATLGGLFSTSQSIAILIFIASAALYAVRGRASPVPRLHAE